MLSFAFFSFRFTLAYFSAIDEKSEDEKSVHVCSIVYGIKTIDSFVYLKHSQTIGIQLKLKTNLCVMWVCTNSYANNSRFFFHRFALNNALIEARIYLCAIDLSARYITPVRERVRIIAPHEELYTTLYNANVYPRMCVFFFLCHI